MPHRRITFSKFIIEDRRRAAEQGGEHGAELAALLNDVQTACKFIAVAVSRGALADAPFAAGVVQTAREPSRPLGVVAAEIMRDICELGGQLCGMHADGIEAPYTIKPGLPRGRYLLLFDPLDGSQNGDVNLTVGTVFSILAAPEGVTEPTEADFLQPGSRQVAAGYALYGPVAMLVVTLGAGVHGFTLDREIGAYTLTHRDMRIPQGAREFAINSSNERSWESPIRRYVEECVEGERGEDFTTRWIAATVAELHRILIRGGMFLYPRDVRDPGQPNGLRLMHAANPVAFLVEQAGGAASTGREPILSLAPSRIDQLVPLMLGAREEVERVVSYHQRYDRGESLKFDVPLFKTRSLFRVS